MASTISMADKQLISKSFKLLCTGIENVSMRDHLNRDLYYNFFSTMVGDNRYINGLTQFSPATDHRYTKFLASETGGMGAQFKRTYDDNASLLTITAGTAEFTGLLSFVSNMFDPVAAIMANKGRAPSAAFYIAQGISSIAFWPVQLINISVNFLYFLADVPRNQFYYVKPTMGMYLTSANNLLNDIATSKGFIKPILAMKKPAGAPINGVDPDAILDYQSELSRLNNLFPDAINADGTLDVIRLVSKGTRKYRQFLDELDKLNDNASITTASEKYAAMQKVLESMQFGASSVVNGYTLNDYLQKTLAGTGNYRSEQEADYPEVASAYLSQAAYVAPSSSQDTVSAGQMESASQGLNSTGDFGTNSGTGDNPTAPNTATPSSVADVQAAAAATSDSTSDISDKSWMGQVMDEVKTAWAGGMDAITWRVEHMGAVTDSFSHSASPSPIADKFNAQVRAVNDVKFDMAGGSLGIPGLDTITNTVKDLATGIVSGMTISNIPMALMNNSFITVPDHWTESSANLHRESYRFHFDATYAHPYSQLTKIWLPFSLLAPLFMPGNAGGSAYTSPFLVKLFSKSRSIIRVGMVESATVTMGNGVGGWTKGRSPLNMTIDLNFVDLEKMVSLPISRTIGALDLTNPASAFKRMIGDVGKYNDYLTRLSGMDYLDTVLRWNKLSNRLTRAQKGIEQSFSASNIAGIVNDSIVGDIGKIFTSQFPR